jgi:hypothetical protein
MNRYLETKSKYYYKTRNYQLAYYKNKYATDEAFRNKILETGKLYYQKNREKCLLAQLKCKRRKHFEKFGWLYRANWEVNIIEKPPPLL